MACTVKSLPGLNGEIIPAGLRNGGRISFVTIDAVSWTALPPVPLAGRNAISIQNLSGTEIKLQYDNTVIGYSGVVMATGSERFYNITDAITIYAKAAAGTPTVTVEEIS